MTSRRSRPTFSWVIVLFFVTTVYRESRVGVLVCLGVFWFWCFVFGVWSRCLVLVLVFGFGLVLGVGRVGRFGFQVLVLEFWFAVGWFCPVCPVLGCLVAVCLRWPNVHDFSKS